MPPKTQKKPGDPQVKKKIANPGLEAMKRQLAKVKAFMTRKRAKEQKEAEEKEYMGTYLPKAKGRRQARLIKQRNKINELLIEANDEIIFLRAFVAVPNRAELLTNTIKDWSAIDNSLPSQLRRVHYYRRDFILTLANLKSNEQLDFAKFYINSLDDIESPVRPFIPRRALDKYIFELQRQVGRNKGNYVLRIDPSIFQEVSKGIWNVRFPSAEKLATVGVYDFTNLVMAANKLLPPADKINRFILNKTQQAAKLLQYFEGQEHRVTDFEPYLPSQSSQADEKKAEGSLTRPPSASGTSEGPVSGPVGIPGALLRPSDVRGAALPQINPRVNAQILAIGGPQALQQYLNRRAIYETRFQMKKAQTAAEKEQARKTQILLNIAEEFKVDPSNLAFEIENPSDMKHIQEDVLPDLAAQGKSEDELYEYYKTQSNLIDARQEYIERIKDQSDRQGYDELRHAAEEEDKDAEEANLLELMDAAERGEEEEKDAEEEVMEEVREANEAPGDDENAGDYPEEEEPRGLRGSGRGSMRRSNRDIADLDDVENMSEAKDEEAGSEDLNLFGGVGEARPPSAQISAQASIQVANDPNLAIKGRGFLVEAGDVAEDIRATEFQGIIIPETLVTYSAAQDWIARHPEYTMNLINTWKTRPWMKEENPWTKYSETVIRAPVSVFRQAYQKTGLDKYLERKGWGHPSELFWILFTSNDPTVLKGFEPSGYHRGRFFIEANYVRVNNNQEVRALLGNPQGYNYERRRFHFDIGLIVQPQHISGQIKRQRFRGTGWAGRKRKADDTSNIEVFPKGKIIDGFHYTYISPDQPVGWHPPGETLRRILSSGDYPYTLEGESLTIEVPEGEGMVKYLFDVRYRNAKRTRPSRTDAMCQFAWMRRPWEQDIFGETVIETDNPKFIRSQYVQPNSDAKVYVPSSTFWSYRCGQSVMSEPNGYLSIRDPVTLTRSRVRIGRVERSTGQVVWESDASYKKGVDWILSHMKPTAMFNVKNFMDKRLSDFVRPYGDGPVEMYINGDIVTVNPGRQKGFRMIGEKKIEYPYLIVEKKEIDMPMVPTMEANIIRYTMVKSLIQNGVPEKTAIECEDTINRENLRVGEYLYRIVSITELLKPPLQYYARTLKGQVKNISGRALATMDPFPELKILNDQVERERTTQRLENQRLGRQIPEEEKISSFSDQFENYINYLTERTAFALQRWKKGTSKAPFAPKSELDIYEIDKASLEQKVTLLRKLMIQYMAERLAAIGSSVNPEQFENEVYNRVGVTNLDEYIFRILVYMEPTRTALSTGRYLDELKRQIPRSLDPYMNDQLVYFHHQKNRPRQQKKVETGLSASRLYRFTKQIMKMIEDWTTESDEELTAKFNLIIQGQLNEEDNDEDMKQPPIGPRRPIEDAPMRVERPVAPEDMSEIISSLNDLSIEDSNVTDLFASLMSSLDRWKI